MTAGDTRRFLRIRPIKLPRGSTNKLSSRKTKNNCWEDVEAACNGSNPAPTETVKFVARKIPWNASTPCRRPRHVFSAPAVVET